MNNLHNMQGAGLQAQQSQLGQNQAAAFNQQSGLGMASGVGGLFGRMMAYSTPTDLRYDFRQYMMECDLVINADKDGE